jgi:hypothetical protein
MEQISGGDPFRKRQLAFEPGHEHVRHAVDMNGVGLEEQRALELVHRASIGRFAIGGSEIGRMAPKLPPSHGFIDHHPGGFAAAHYRDRKFAKPNDPPRLKLISPAVAG